MTCLIVDRTMNSWPDIIAMPVASMHTPILLLTCVYTLSVILDTCMTCIFEMSLVSLVMDRMKLNW